MPIVRFNSQCKVFGVMSFEVDRSRLPLIDGEHIWLSRRLLQPPPEASIPTINFVSHEPCWAHPRLKSFHTAGRTIRGYETMNMIRQGQIYQVEKGDVEAQVKFIAQIFGIAT